MNSAKLNDMIGGWFVGGFCPAALSTSNCEVAVKRYVSGSKEDPHFHAVATEVTLILSGKARMRDCDLSDGDIIVLEPGEISSFEALTDVVSVVVKVPGVLNDKYFPEGNLFE